MKKTSISRSVLLFLALLLLAGCTARAPQAVGNSTAAPAGETPAAQVTEVTREVPVTVVVTATPIPTPAYTSPVTAITGTLTYPLDTDPISLAPQDADDEVSLLVAQQLYEGLFNLRGDGSTVPAAATGFVPAADSKVYTVTLRSGMIWSDGQPVLAQQYVDGVCRVLDPTVGNAYYYLLTDIVAVQGAREYASGDLADCKKVGVQAVDDLTLRITLEQPAALLPKLLTMPVFWPAPPTAVSGTAPLSDPQAGALPVNGPYLLTEWVRNDHITLSKNPDYWNAQQVGPERIELRIAPDSAEQLARYERGDLQVASFPADATQRIQADPAFAQELLVLVQPGVSYLALNTQAGPTADVNVRRAIASAIDRQALIDAVLKQPWHVATQRLIPPDILGHQGDEAGTGYPYSPEAAAEFLAEAGYGPEKPAPPIEIWYNREGNNEPLFKAIGQMLEQAGIPVRLTSSRWDVYLAALDGCNKPNRAAAAKTPAQCSYNAYRMGWVMEYADPSNLLDTVFSPKSVLQYTGWQSAEYEKLLAQAQLEQDEAQRGELYREAESLLLDEAVAVVPLQYYDRTVLVKAGITADFPPFGPPNLQYWKLRP